MSALLSETVLGVWLLLSAFLWPHSKGQLLVAVVGGVLCIGYCVRAMLRRHQDVRLAAVAAWVLVGAFVLPAGNRMTVANHALVAGALLALAAIAGGNAGTKSREKGRHR
jgi:hypothetical protein